mmetsp:Transcript_14529/g.39629  ORF Transcript_14529/g.39629 Transcript_14529/m.39629 type:complete len:112 (-) Transcript_14529:74-409(-)
MTRNQCSALPCKSPVSWPSPFPPFGPPPVVRPRPRKALGPWAIQRTFFIAAWRAACPVAMAPGAAGNSDQMQSLMQCLLSGCKASANMLQGQTMLPRKFSTTSANDTTNSF